MLISTYLLGFCVCVKCVYVERERDQLDVTAARFVSFYSTDLNFGSKISKDRGG